MGRGLISLMIVGAVVLAAVAVVVLRPAALERVLPPAAVAFLDRLGGPAPLQSSAPQPDDTPTDFLADSLDGLQAVGPIAAHAGNRPVFIADVIAGHRTPTAADIPAEITTIRPILGCMLTPPLAGSVVGHVTSGQSGLALALSTYNDTHLAKAVQDFVSLYREMGPAPDAGPDAGPDSERPMPVVSEAPVYEAYDVAITETSAPVYLVLENRGGNRIWNLHLAEGARIERVVLLGGDQAGVANLDPVVPVEVILQDGLTGCGIQPAYDLNPGHRLLQPGQGGTLSSTQVQARLAAIRDSAAAYDIWFRDSFGVLAGQSRVGFDKGTLSVIGPLPGAAVAKAAYAPISGARIRTTQDLFFEIRGQVAKGQDFAARVRAIATGFAFGDLATLRQGVDF